MIDAELLAIVYLLYYGLLLMTIINVALVIAFAILLIKQQKKISHSALQVNDLF